MAGGGRAGKQDSSEARQHLWLIAISPTVWAVHFLACYITAAIWCAKAGRASELGGVRTAIAAYTALALAAILYTGWVGLRRHRFGTATVPHDFDTADDRHRFLGFATVLLSGLSAVGVVYTALPALFFEMCW